MAGLNPATQPARKRRTKTLWGADARHWLAASRAAMVGRFNQNCSNRLTA